MLSNGLLACAAIYCVVRATDDLRRGRHLWAAPGAAAALVLLLMPVQTHAVKIDLPSAAPPR